MTKSIRSLRSVKTYLNKDDSTAVDGKNKQNKQYKCRLVANKTVSENNGRLSFTSPFKRSIEAKPRNVASFYNKDEILKNRVGANRTAIAIKPFDDNFRSSINRSMRVDRYRVGEE